MSTIREGVGQFICGTIGGFIGLFFLDGASPNFNPSPAGYAISSLLMGLWVVLYNSSGSNNEDENSEEEE